MLGCWSPAGLVRQTELLYIHDSSGPVMSRRHCFIPALSNSSSYTCSAFSFQVAPKPCEKRLWCRGPLCVSTLLIYSVLLPVVRLYADHHLLQMKLLRWCLRAPCTEWYRDGAVESIFIQCPCSRIMVNSHLGLWAPNHLFLDRSTEPGMCFLPCSEP